MDGLPASAGKFLYLGATAETVGKDYGGTGSLSNGKEHAFGASFAHFPVTWLKSKVAGKAATPAGQPLDVRTHCLEELRVNVRAIAQVHCRVQKLGITVLSSGTPPPTRRSNDGMNSPHAGSI